MDENSESLFSLELVVEKLYLPHITCRFPAVAFRLLDFPTIVIKHVEDDLGKVIHKKILFESPNHLPQQFHELKDRHGNFMVKKGKSCLFKMKPDILKQHLTSTPLYVMIIDLFPKVPKLLGNSTVPLDSLINLVLVDIAKVGPTVPSVHGDKGLFKLYNLMGHEIGYLVLGLRLLCLGPSLIPHIPHNTMAQMQPHENVISKDEKIDELLRFQDRNEERSEHNDKEDAVNLRDSFSMTDPMKQDVFQQTVELEEKGVYVNIHTEPSYENLQAPPIPVTNVASTQTERQRSLKKPMKEVNKWVERTDMKIEDDGIMMNNIICPPPLFYNSEGTPVIQIQRAGCRDDEDEDISIEDLSEGESFDGYGLAQKKNMRKVGKGDGFDNERGLNVNEHVEQEKIIHHQSQKYVPQARQGEKISGLQVAPQSETVFPLLSALINELSCIQDPSLLLNVSQKLQKFQYKESIAAQIAAGKTYDPSPSAKMHTPPVVAAVASALTKKLNDSEINLKEKEKHEKQSDKKEQNKTISQEKTTSQERAQNAKKKSKLVYGLTNTQRLRLEKVNPTWLKNKEKDALSFRSKKASNSAAVEIDEMNTTNFSDTLTEVRRLAEQELNSTAGGDTLRQVASEVEEFDTTLKSNKSVRTSLKKSSPSVKRTTVIKPGISEKSPCSTMAMQGNQQSGNQRKHGLHRSPLKSSSQRSSARSTTTKSTKTRAQQRRALHIKSKEKQHIDDSSDSDELLIKKRPVPLERHTFGITSPSLDDQGQKMNDYEDVLSARSDVPSSRSRSIDVRLPSAEPDIDDNATISDDEDRIVDDDQDDEDIPLPDESLKTEPKVMELNFPRYVSREMSLPDSIEGNPNGSLNISGEVTHDSPLESTRQSRNINEEQNESRQVQSTDYDTRQFHSTDEPELQGLMSEEENQSGADNSGAHSLTSVHASQKFPVINPQLSENSPVPSVRRSTTKLDAGALSYLPSMSLSKGQMSPTSSRPSTPKLTSHRKKSELEPIHKNPRSSLTPRSGASSPRKQTPRSRRQILDFKTSIHTDSVSSYLPSDPDNALVSLSSNSGNYSDDFQPLASGESGEASSVEQLPKILPSKKLGYTIS